MNTCICINAIFLRNTNHNLQLFLYKALMLFIFKFLSYWYIYIYINKKYVNFASKVIFNILV